MDTRNYTLQVWQTFGDLYEIALKGGVVHQIFYCIESEANPQLEKIQRWAEQNLPSIDIRDFAQGHAQPDAEQSFP